MSIVEDQVKNSIKKFLIDQGYEKVICRLGTRQGHDVEGINPVTKRKFVIECKGEAMKGSQLARSWGNVASALLTALNETNAPNKENDVAIALPNTSAYRDRLLHLRQLLDREKITVYWVSENSSVTQW